LASGNNRLQATTGFRQQQASGNNRLQATTGFNGEFIIDVTSSEIPIAFCRDGIEKFIF